MSGHSKWSTIKRQKEATDAKRGAVFTKVGNQIAIAARSGADPEMNPNLAMAIEKAKAANMPLSNIQRAIDRVKDKNSAALEEVLYEGYGSGGVGILIECATDNRNRTFPEVRTALTKNGGSVAEPGSVAFQFTRKGIIRVEGGGDDLMLQALDAGAEDVKEDEQETIIYTNQKDLAKVRDALKDIGIKIIDAELSYVPNNFVETNDPEVIRKVENVLDALDELEDVSNVHSNFEPQVNP